MMHSLNEWLWWHEYWLPPGITWEDMKESEDIHYPQPQDLLLSIPCALLLIIIRYLFESPTVTGVSIGQPPLPGYVDSHFS
uniref:CERS5 n=1 Tax=Chelonoidis abingdonii TaxID=106734 RepID=A0A8C0JA31_CHEAB